MDLGTGIFLSSIVLAVVILYGITKDRWRWRCIAKRAALICLGLVVLGTGLGVGAYYWDQLPRPRVKQTEYAGIRIGMSQNEVKYVKGYPPHVFGPLEESGDWKGMQPFIETKKLEKDKRVEDYADWSYGAYNSRIDVQFDPKRTGVIVVQCYSNDKLRRCPSVEGISDGDSEKEVVRVFGQPDASKIEGVTKSIHYKNLGVFFILTQESVYTVGVNDTKYQNR